ncbi:MAG: TolC family protein [Bacteroidales bacterium]
MSLMAQAKFESFRDAKLSLFYDVQRTWYELSKYQQDICISESNIAILKTIERLALARFKSPLQAGENSVSGEMRPAGDMAANSSESSGMGSMAGMAVNTGGAAPARASSSMPGNTMSSEAGISGLADLYRIQIEIGDLEDNIASLKNMMQSVTARFNLFLNRPVTSPVSLPDTILPELFDIPLSAVTDSMLANNPMLKMLEQEKQAFEARYRMVKSMSYPMIGLGLDYSIIGKSYMSASAMNGSDMVMPMITFTLPVYRKKYNAMKSEAELLKTAASQGYTETSNTLQAEFYQAVRLFQDALRRQKLYTDQCRLAEKSLNIMLKAFASNNASLTDILRIRQQVLDYKFRQIEAVADYNTAVAWLWKLMANKI